jgi:hypothetical protein
MFVFLWLHCLQSSLNTSNYMLPVRVTFKMGFWIGWLHLLKPYSFTTRDYRYYSATTDLYTLYFTVAHALGFSVFTSRIMAMDLSQSPCNFKSHMKASFHSLIPFLALFLTRFIPLLSISYFGRLASRNSTPHSRLDYYPWSPVLTVSFYKPSARTTQKTQPLLLRTHFYWSVA